jgi:glycosyltransferase involved in cell wall biosynthesis
MKLSICIPVFNFDVNDLVRDLAEQIVSDRLDAEIILIDDASTDIFVKINHNLKDKVSSFIFLEENIGRSRIRNLFLDYTPLSTYLLFLDCDGKIISKSFLKTYCDFIERQNPDVIFGGRQVSNIKPSSEYGLRWKFATERENLPVQKRLISPYLDFQTNNFVVKRSVLERIPFNTSITQYGYEDLVFSKDLQDHSIKIDHIENPVFNNDVESNDVFLSKADESAKSLAQLIKTDENFDKVSDIRLVKAYLVLRKMGLIEVYLKIYRITKNRIIKKLLSGNVSLKMLDLYKLGQFIGYMNKAF